MNEVQTFTHNIVATGLTTGVAVVDRVEFVFRAPLAAQGGGVSIVGAWMVGGSACTGDDGYRCRLLKYSSAATPVLNGTISDYMGGTTDGWVATVPKVATIGTAWVPAGEWVALDIDRITSGTIAPPFSLTVQYKMGRSST